MIIADNWGAKIGDGEAGVLLSQLMARSSAATASRKPHLLYQILFRNRR